MNLFFMAVVLALVSEASVRQQRYIFGTHCTGQLVRDRTYPEKQYIIASSNNFVYTCDPDKKTLSIVSFSTADANCSGKPVDQTNQTAGACTVDDEIYTCVTEDETETITSQLIV